MAAREIYFKSPLEDTGGALLLIPLSLSCLKFMDFLISFLEMIIIIP